MTSSRILTVILCLVVGAGCTNHEITIDNQPDGEDVGTDSHQDTGPDTAEDTGDDTDSGTDEPVVTPEDLEEAAVSQQAAECDRLLECCNDDELFAEFRGTTDVEDVEDCIEAKSGFFTTGTSGLSQLANDDRIAFNPEQVEVCRDAVTSLSCREFAATDSQILDLPGCRKVLEPLVEEGESCEFDFECKTDFCHIRGEDDEDTCEVPPGEGQECANYTCGEDLYCDDTTGICEPRRPLGEGCLEDEECKTDFCGADEDDENELSSHICKERASSYCTGD